MPGNLLNAPRSSLVGTKLLKFYLPLVSLHVLLLDFQLAMLHHEMYINVAQQSKSQQNSKDIR